MVSRSKKQPTNPSAVQSIPLDRIDPHPQNPREAFDVTDLATLAESMTSLELLQPITVKPSGDRFVILAGERRWRAAKLAGWRSMPAFVRDLSDEQAAIVLAEDNLHHKELNPIEQANAVALLVRPIADGGAGLTNVEVARRLGKEPCTIANLLRLLKLPEEWQAETAAGGLLGRQAKSLASYADRPDVLAAAAVDRQANPDDWASANQFDKRLAEVAQRVGALLAAADRQTSSPATAAEEPAASPVVLSVRRLPVPAIGYLIDCINRITKREDLRRLLDAVAARMEELAKRNAGKSSPSSRGNIAAANGARNGKSKR